MRIPMFRLFLVVLLGAAVVAGWLGLFPIPFKDVFGGSAERVSDTSIVDSYRADFVLDPDGKLTSTEVIDVEFTQYNKHGIYRIFDTQDAQYRNVQHPVTVVSVERQTNREQWVPEPYVVSQDGGGTMTIRVGSEYRTFDPGIQRYRIVSTTSNALTKPKDGPEGAGSQWYWDVVGTGWTMPMRKVAVSAALPPTVQPPICEASSACEIREEDGRYRIEMSQLPAYTAVTMKAYFAADAPGVQRTTWQNIVLFGTLAFVGLTLALVGLTFARSRERRPDISPRFEPPGPDPLTCAWTLDESPASRGVPAVLLNLVAHGVVGFDAEQRSVQDSDGPDWISLTRTTAPVPDLVGFAAALNNLGLYQPGSSRTISKDSVSDGKLLSSLDDEITGEIDDRVMREGFATRVGGSGWALLFAFLAIIGGFSALIWLNSGLLVATLLLVAAAAGLLINRRDTTRLTDRGAAMRDATAGFKQVLSTPASVERFDYAARVRHFDEFLPWAVAFDCADEWAASCTPPPGSPEASAMARDVRVLRLAHLHLPVVGAVHRCGGGGDLSRGGVPGDPALLVLQRWRGGGGGGGGSGGGGGGSW